ncbi:MAG: efflux RND transporter periplasmic adaptor subunit [Deltaproteobacteria bacterium]|nr:efflux RND transporter periplasmic adaptor subunit [Deltaproteobacteria bacterium]
MGVLGVAATRTFFRERVLFRSTPLWLLNALLLLGLASCEQHGQSTKKKKQPLPMVECAPVEVKTLTERLALTGSIEPTRTARMASPVEGPVIACPVREGDRVRTGQLLARLGRTKGDDAAAASARADLEREELERSRIEKLVQTGALPAEELDKARVKVSEAQARLARAAERLGDYRVAAPWRGVVSKVHVAVGDFVSARSALVELFDPESLVLRFAVPEDSAARVANGAAVSIALDAHPGKPLEASVARIYPEIDRRSHTRTVEAKVETELSLAPGMFARLELTLLSEPDALVVPAHSVLRRDGQSVVFVITEELEAEQHRVELGIADGGLIQIRGGLSKGQRVAVAGHARLRHGVKVRLAGARGPRSGGEKGR